MACVGGVPGPAASFVGLAWAGRWLLACALAGWGDQLLRGDSTPTIQVTPKAVGEHAVEQRESSGRRGMRMAQVQPGTELGDDGIQQPVHVGGRFQALAKAA